MTRSPPSLNLVTIHATVHQPTHCICRNSRVHDNNSMVTIITLFRFSEDFLLKVRVVRVESQCACLDCFRCFWQSWKSALAICSLITHTVLKPPLCGKEKRSHRMCAGVLREMNHRPNGITGCAQGQPQPLHNCEEASRDWSPSDGCCANKQPMKPGVNSNQQHGHIIGAGEPQGPPGHATQPETQGN